jgi:hypothetical protein
LPCSQLRTVGLQVALCAISDRQQQSDTTGVASLEYHRCFITIAITITISSPTIPPSPRKTKTKQTNRNQNQNQEFQLKKVRRDSNAKN